MSELNLTEEDINESYAEAIELILDDDRTTKTFNKASEILKDIDVSHKDNEDLFDLFIAARFIDMRCRVGGREHYFDANFLRSKFYKLQKEANKTWWQKLFCL